MLAGVRSARRMTGVLTSSMAQSRSPQDLCTLEDKPVLRRSKDKSQRQESFRPEDKPGPGALRISHQPEADVIRGPVDRNVGNDNYYQRQLRYWTSDVYHPSR